MAGSAKKTQHMNLSLLSWNWFQKKTACDKVREASCGSQHCLINLRMHKRPVNSPEVTRFRVSEERRVAPMSFSQQLHGASVPLSSLTTPPPKQPNTVHLPPMTFNYSSAALYDIIVPLSKCQQQHKALPVIKLSCH